MHRNSDYRHREDCCTHSRKMRRHSCSCDNYFKSFALCALCIFKKYIRLTMCGNNCHLILDSKLFQNICCFLPLQAYLNHCPLQFLLFCHFLSPFLIDTCPFSIHCFTPEMKSYFPTAHSVFFCARHYKSAISYNIPGTAICPFDINAV